MALPTQLIDKYTHYQSIGHGVYCVTLSTYVKCPIASTRFPVRKRATRLVSKADDRWRMFWDHHFIYGVKECLPYRAKLDHDWALEVSPDGHYHYHGALAVDSATKHRLWTHDGLNRRLRRRLDSFKERGRYRPFCVNAHLIEPMESVAEWITYSTKESPMYLNTNVLPRP